MALSIVLTRHGSSCISKWLRLDHLPPTRIQARWSNPADIRRVPLHDETSNKANPLPVSHSHTRPGCSGYSPHVARNPDRRGSCVPNSAVARYLTHLSPAGFHCAVHLSVFAAGIRFLSASIASGNRNHRRAMSIRRAGDRAGLPLHRYETDALPSPFESPSAICPHGSPARFISVRPD